MEGCYHDRVIVRPIRGDHSITIDAVLFDRHGNFVGPISEIVGGSNVPRYVVRSDELCRRLPLRQGDTLYYYNSDRVGKMDMEEDEYEEFKLFNTRSDQQTQSSLNLRKVICNLKNLRIDNDYQESSMIIDERHEAASREAKASLSTNSLIYKLKQKKRHQARSHKKFREDMNNNGCMDEEVAALGKRCQPSSNSGTRKHKKRNGTKPNRSSGSSRLSHISEPSTLFSHPTASVSGIDFGNLLGQNETSENMMEEQLPGCWLFQNKFLGRK